MKISVFIPTFNGQAKLKQLLSRLELQSDDSFVVHVLIDGSTDDTYLLKDIFPKVHFHSFPNAGRAGIRNRASEFCKDGIILFLDDDMLPEPNLVATHRAFHESNSNSILIGNGFRNPEGKRDVFSAYLITMEETWIKSHPTSFQVTEDDFVFTACNLSLPLDLFVRMNRFNPLLKDGEDFDFGMRALESKINIVFNRSALAWHNDWPTLSQYIRRNSEYLAGKKALVQMKPEYEKQLRVAAGERSHNQFKQFFQRILGNMALRNSFVFQLLPLPLKFIAIKSAIYKFTTA